MIKLFLCLIKHHATETHEGVYVQLLASVNCELERVECSPSRWLPPPGERVLSAFLRLPWGVQRRSG